ncbi:MAG TPA: 23S rRNA (adenine(2503)-C(2))-methyltransferase RlmN [Lachnospiraceae bacterium]|nr:23S rRNA (adenine(2503)-C(2))-methyltransferase RlmN [Lachnospiraceae bacterium]
MEKTDIRSLHYTELEKAFETLLEKKFRAKQVYDWLHCKQADDFSEMTNLSKDLRKKCGDYFDIYTVRPVEILESQIDGTKKYLFRLHDDHIIESVFMRYEYGNSVCVSSQVGCRMGCRFCASTIDGLNRDLTSGEMLGQIYGIMKETGERISHVVVMGSGEPLDNYENFLKFITMLTDEHGLHLSQRNVTVSTCGLAAEIKRLAEEKLQITLAISLHAPTDKKRSELMPITQKYPLAELMEACRYYFDRTGRRLTFEYSLIGGVNDTPEDAAALTGLLRGLNCHINLIPVNPVKERSYIQSEREVIRAFKNKLEKNHLNVTVRREMGRDIDGACGQLRRSYMEDTRMC